MIVLGNIFIYTNEIQLYRLLKFEHNSIQYKNIATSNHIDSYSWKKNVNQDCYVFPTTYKNSRHGASDRFVNGIENVVDLQSLRVSMYIANVGTYISVHTLLERTKKLKNMHAYTYVHMYVFCIFIPMD